MLRGELEIDTQRRNAHDRLLLIALGSGGASPTLLIEDIKTLDPRLHFYIPAVEGRSTSGKIIRSYSDDRPWDLGSKRANWDVMMGAAWDCLKPQFLYGKTSVTVSLLVQLRLCRDTDIDVPPQIHIKPMAAQS